MYMDMENLNLLGHYIWRRIQKDNTDNRYTHGRPKESMSGLYIGPNDIQRYINDYFQFGIDHMGDDDCADDVDKYDPQIIPFGELPKYWDDPDGKEE